MNDRVPDAAAVAQPAGDCSWRRLQPWARRLKRQAVALGLAAGDPRTPWYAKLLAAAVVAYAVSPVDLIPDVVPVLGLLDDLILVPLGVALCVRLIPPAVWADALARAESAAAVRGGRVAAAVIVALWLALLAAAAVWIGRRLLP